MQYPGTVITDQYPSRMLCGKRYDNAFSFASSSSGKPHTCFEDTILVPLASWIFYLALIGYVIYAMSAMKRGNGNNGKASWHKLIHRKHSTSDAALLQANDKDAEIASSTQRGNTTNTKVTRWPKTTTFFSILYSLLVLATLLMNILEIVRLYLANRGAGLLPFTLASLVIVIVLMHLPLPLQLKPATGSVILVFWVFSLIFTSVQIATLTSLQGIEPRTATEYLDSDQIIDLAVIIALYALEVVVESYRVVRAYQAKL